MYTIEIRENKKLFIVTMSGFMKEEESIAYLEDYVKKVQTIVPSEYTCIVNTHELKTASQNLTGLMIRAQELIINTPFKMRYSIMPDSLVASSQIKRLGREDHVLDNTIIVNDYTDVMKLVNF